MGGDDHKVQTGIVPVDRHLRITLNEVDTMKSNAVIARPFAFCLLITLAVSLFAVDGRAAQKKNGNKKDIPLAARVVLAKAGALINEKNYAKAVETLTAFQARGDAATQPGQSDPKGYHHAEIYFALGTCHLFQKNSTKAVEAFEKALKQDPGHVSAWLNLAKASYDLNDYAKAARCFEQAYTHSETQNPEHLYYCAAAHLMAQQNERSIAVFDRLFQQHPDQIQPSWRENYVHALLSADRPRRALPHIRRLAQEYTGDKQVQWQEILLHQYMQLDMREQARSYALFLTRQAPTRAKWWKALAHVRLQDGNYPPALTALTIYSYLKPLTEQETKLLADLHLQLGIPVKAAPLYQAALQKQTDKRLLHNLMLALQQLGQPEQALKSLKQIAPKTKDPDLLMLKADLLYGLERFREAEQAYRVTARLDTEQPHRTGRAWLMAGYAALQANDVDAGRQAFKQAAAFKQQRKAALLAMRRLPKTQQRLTDKQPSM